jgi:type II secretory pathway predicted ATPase ExeA
MIYKFFNLDDCPFRLDCDTRYLYLSKLHAEARANLEYALLNNVNIVVLTGEIGAGKSIVVQRLLEDTANDVIPVKIHQTQLTVIEFLQMLLLELGVKSFHERKVELLSQLKEVLLKHFHNNQRVLLIIDEAQHLKREVLEEIRLISDLEYEHHKLISVFLVGQPELNNTLDMPELEQLKQRIRLRFHLQALEQSDIKSYITFRLNVAGKENELTLSDEIYPIIYNYSGGRPRLVNVIVDHALTCAFANSTKTITGELLEQAIDELGWKPFKQSIDKAPLLTEEKDHENGYQFIFLMSKENEYIGEFHLDKEKIMIGRYEDNDLVLNDEQVSRYHAHVTISGDEAILSDLNSSNGTFINMKKINQKKLVEGAIINIGNYMLEFFKNDIRGGNQPKNDNIVRYPVKNKMNKNN